MWEYVRLPQESDDPQQKEAIIRQFAEEKLREYDGTAFFCISRADKERRLTFRQAAQAVGCSARDGRAMCTAFCARELADLPRRNVLFVEPSMQQYLDEYLDACPAGVRHVLIYSRRRGNGACLRMSLFMDFWQEHGVDIWDLNEN